MNARAAFVTRLSRVLLNSNRQFAAPKPAAAKAPVGAKVVGAVGGKEEKGFVETDAEKLAKFVCINYLVNGEEPGPAIKPDSEYPAWLFELDLARPKELEDMEPETDGWMYWRAIAKRVAAQEKRHRMLRLRRLSLQNSPSLRGYSKFNLPPK